MKHAITIETGIPIPPPSKNFNRKPKRPLRLAIEALKPGDSFVIPKKDVFRATASANNAKVKIITRVIPGTNNIRVWLKPEVYAVRKNS